MTNLTRSNVKGAAGRRGFLSRLRYDVAGNTLFIVAAATIPLVGLIGAGVDVSRTYLVKSRLQQACDAGVLAGRKFMTTNALSTSAAAQAQSYFTNNFPTGAFGTSAINFTPTANASGVVTGTAVATVPATVMTAFGNGSVPLTVVCKADLEVANTDVMFVLDTTGSMACDPDGTDCDADSNSKIVGLRSAVVSFYAALTANASATTRNRFGFVPYSMGVNVGGSLPASSLVDSWSYQSRVANMTTAVPGYTYSDTEVLADQVKSGVATQAECVDYGTRDGDPIRKVSGAPPTEVIITFSNDASAGIDWGYPGSSQTTGTERSCRRHRVRQTRTTTAGTGGYRFTNWTYRSDSYDVSTYKTGADVSFATNAPTGTVPTSGSYDLMQLAAIGSAGTTNTTLNWSTHGKCIEERDTVTQATYATVPSGAYDLEIDTLPTTNATKWRPAFVDLIYDRTNQSAETTTNDYSTQYGGCPAAASKLAVMTQAQVQTYVDGLYPEGNTYHDLGMIWGARFISPTGIFAAENTTAPNGAQINRHIIFMTDGIMANNPYDYSTYGFERLDTRIAPYGSDSTTLISRHGERFSAMCNAARAKNITVWVVAFGTSLTTQLSACADPGKAFQASDTATLTSQFQQIASRIADLRLTQ